MLFEWLRSWLLTGFPWLYAGYGALDSPLAGWIPVVGVYGTSWFLVAIGCLVANAVSQPRDIGRWVGAAAVVGPSVLAGLILQRTEWTVPQGEAVTVAVVQPNVPLKEKWDPRFRSGILSDFGTRSEALAQDHDLVVWPESALPGYRDRLLDVIEAVDQQLAQLDSTLITGIPTRDNAGRYNSITALGAGSGTYHKQKLVPFGEYVPMERWLRGAIAFFDLPMSQFVAGKTEQRPLLAGNLPVAPFICLRDCLPGLRATLCPRHGAPRHHQ
ncbi:MAG: hypothetical protein CM15mP74_23030 [Halieaceae bacterium]|nr:MAG: hypothetical protein CM15mP74_23030 [Halieaceae bacterium]